ncbi:hypothetical protein [Streptomyces sp. NPDC002573]|uniref:hypothetical protein n=1 Tax=Streptomyces sp. NPDC002573 TaxID=3364651 RepID=UPI0036749797
MSGDLRLRERMFRVPIQTQTRPDSRAHRDPDRSPRTLARRPAAQADPAPQAAHHSVDTGPAVRHDTFPTLRSMVAHAHHGHHGKKQQDDDPGEARLPHPPASHIPDPVVQSSPGGPSAPSTGTNFEGIGASNYSISGVPPDPNAAVGSSQIVETVTTAYAVYSESGATVLAPTDTSTLWSGFGGSCQSTNDDDGVVRWDTLANRWVVTQFANVSSSSGPYYECVAVSRRPPRSQLHAHAHQPRRQLHG